MVKLSSSRFGDNITGFSKDINLKSEYNFYFTEEFKENIANTSEIAKAFQEQVRGVTENIDFLAIQENMYQMSAVINQFQTIVPRFLNENMELYKGIFKVLNDIDFTHMKQLTDSIQMISLNIGEINKPLFKVLYKQQNWLATVEFSDEDISYATEILESDDLENFLTQDFPDKKEEDLTKEEKSLFVKLKLVVDVITLILTFIFPPFEVNVTNIQENYNIHIENATFYSDKEGIKWLNDELAKEHLEQNYSIVTKDNLVVRTEMIIAEQ